MLRIEDDMRQDKATTSLPRANNKKKKEALEDVDCEHPLFGRLLCGGGYERDLQMSMSMPFDGKDKDKKSGKKSGGDDRCSHPPPVFCPSSSSKGSSKGSGKVAKGGSVKGSKGSNNGTSGRRHGRLLRAKPDGKGSSNKGKGSNDQGPTVPICVPQMGKGSSNQIEYRTECIDYDTYLELTGFEVPSAAPSSPDAV